MSDYAPSTDAIRGRIIQRGAGWGFYSLAEFDRWLAEHDRQVAERAWDRCVGEMPIDPDWKNFYSDQNPYTKGEQK